MYYWKLHGGGSKHHSTSNLWSACNTLCELQAGRLGQCTSLYIESGIRLASGRNSRGSAKYEQVRSRITVRGTVTTHCIKWYSQASRRWSTCKSGSMLSKRCKLGRSQTLSPRESPHSQHFKSLKQIQNEGNMVFITWVCTKSHRT